MINGQKELSLIAEMRRVRERERENAWRDLVTRVFILKREALTQPHRAPRTLVFITCERSSPFSVDKALSREDCPHTVATAAPSEVKGTSLGAASPPNNRRHPRRLRLSEEAGVVGARRLHQHPAATRASAFVPRDCVSATTESQTGAVAGQVRRRLARRPPPPPVAAGASQRARD